MTELLLPSEVDARLRLNPGQARRMARRGQLAGVRLPNGEIRIYASELERILADVADLAEDCQTLRLAPGGPAGLEFTA